MIYCIGDVHGDMESFFKVLSENGIIDKSGSWSAGSAILVQMGDVLDGRSRGGRQFVSHSNDVDILRYLLSLRKQARGQGGDVKCLLGNHELMNLVGIYDYVAPRDMSTRNKPEEISELIAELCEPWVEHGKLVFCHAGISPDLDGITNSVLRSLAGKLKSTSDMLSLAKNPILAAEGGITTTRYYYDRTQDPFRVRALLDSLGYDRMFIGHNFVSKDIGVRCSGRVVLTDTGISRAMSSDRSSEIVVVKDDLIYACRAGKLRPI